VTLLIDYAKYSLSPLFPSNSVMLAQHGDATSVGQWRWVYPDARSGWPCLACLLVEFECLLRELFVFACDTPYITFSQQIQSLATQLAKANEEKQAVKSEADALREQVGEWWRKALHVEPCPDRHSSVHPVLSSPSTRSTMRMSPLPEKIQSTWAMILVGLRCPVASFDFTGFFFLPPSCSPPPFPTASPQKLTPEQEIKVLKQKIGHLAQEKQALAKELTAARERAETAETAASVGGGALVGFGGQHLVCLQVHGGTVLCHCQPAHSLRHTSPLGARMRT
jgi:regulator of replication initiation timing